MEVLAPVEDVARSGPGLLGELAAVAAWIWNEHLTIQTEEVVSFPAYAMMSGRRLVRVFKRSAGLLAAAQAYVDHGIAVMPGSPMVPDPETTNWRTSWLCSCGDRWCGSPGMHPLTPALIDTRSEVDELWGVPLPPNVLIASGPAVAVWRVPLALGSYGMRRLEQQRPSVWPPVMRIPGGGWVFCTEPVGPGFTSAPDVELVTSDGPVLAPPSRGAGGVHRWLWSRTFPAAPLTSAEAVMAALTAARSDHLAVGF